jgi:hypothetical protein
LEAFAGRSTHHRSSICSILRHCCEGHTCSHREFLVCKLAITIALAPIPYFTAHHETLCSVSDQKCKQSTAGRREALEEGKLKRIMTFEVTAFWGLENERL